MAMTIDILIAVILIVTTAMGYRKGLVLTLCGVLAVLVALVGANVISGALAEPVANAIQPALQRSIQRQLETSLAAAGSAALPADLPLNELLGAIQSSGLLHAIGEAFQSAVAQGLAQITGTAAQSLAQYAAVQIARTVLFALSFVAISAVWFVLSRALDLACKLPVLSTLNRWAGAAVGLGKGLVLVLILCWLVAGRLVTPEDIAGSHLLRFFCAVDPFVALTAA